MGVRRTGQRAFTVYYAGNGEMLRHGEGGQGDGQQGIGERRKQGSSANPGPRKASSSCGSSAFVTDGALLGIKPIRRDAEHIVALDADAVDDRADDGAGLDWFVQATRRRGDGFFRDAISGHKPILARRDLPSIGSRRHPGDRAAHLLDAGNARLGKSVTYEQDEQRIWRKPLCS